MDLFIKKIYITTTLLLTALISYILSKLFVVSRYETLMTGIKGYSIAITIIFLIALVLFLSSKLERRVKIVLYLSLYIIFVLSFFFDLYNLNMKKISIILILILSILSGMAFNTTEGDRWYEHLKRLFKN